MRYLAKKVRNNEDANDLAQEAFLRMHRFQQSSELDNARAFLFRTANNLVIDQIRRDKVHDKYLSSEMLPEQSDENEDKFAPSAERTASAAQELDKIYKQLLFLRSRIAHEQNLSFKLTDCCRPGNQQISQ